MTAVPVLSFEPESHEYRLHDPALPAHTGRILPSVTQTLERAGLIEDADFFTEESRIRGRYVHRAVMYEERQGVDESSIDGRLRPYIEAYRRFKRETNPGPCELIETPLADPVLGVAGTPDQVRPLHDRRTLLDLKSGQPARWHSVQTSAYEHLVVLHHPDWRGLRRVALYLSKDGRYQLVEHKDRRDFLIFRAALTLLQFKERG